MYSLANPHSFVEIVKVKNDVEPYMNSVSFHFCYKHLQIGRSLKFKTCKSTQKQKQSSINTAALRE